MQLLVIRHAIAEDKDAFAKTGRPDTERPLTDEGKAQMRVVAKGMRNVLPRLNVLATSPLVRAAQTAAIVSAEYSGMEVVTIASLSPESRPEAFTAWLGAQADDALVGIVGHDPHLGKLVTWLLAASWQPRVEIEKGGSCLLEIERAPSSGSAKLLWALTPELWIRLARGNS